MLHPAARLGACFVVAFLVLGAVPALVVAGLAQLGVDVGTGDAPMEWRMLGFVVAAAVIAGLTALQPPAAPWRPARAGWTLLRYAAFVVPWLVLVVVYLRVCAALGVGVVPQGQLEYLARGDLLRPGFWVVTLGIVVAAPLAEEVLFRGFLQGALQRLLPTWAAVSLAAAVFGVVHSLPYALPIGALGAFFGWLFARGGSLLPCVLAHAVHNGLTVAVAILWPGHLELLYPR